MQARLQMSRATPKMREFAKRRIDCETRGTRSAGNAKAPAAFRVCEKMRPHVAALMGNAGFRALLARALALGSVEARWLRGVQVKSDGSLEGVDEPRAQAVEPAEGSVVLVAQLLGLLVAFIGENLTLRLMSEVWPKLYPKALQPDKGGKNENED